MLGGCSTSRSPSDHPETILTPTQPSNPTPPSPPAFTPRRITLGETVTDLFYGNALAYEVSAPVGGTLVVRLSWERRTVGYENADLMLTIGECAVPLRLGYPPCPSAREFGSDPKNWSSPIIAQLGISQGQKYRIIVDEGLYPWDYGFNQPFSVIASIE